MINIEIYRIILALLMATASGLVGSFALMRRMTLAGDAFAHIALPGLALAVIYSVNPIIGAGVALLIGSLIIWKVEKLSKLNTEAIVGVLLALSLALGVLLVEDGEQLLALLLGNEGGVTFVDFIIGSVMSLLVILFIIKKRYALTLSLISKELAKTVGVSNDKLQLSFLIIFSLTVLLGLKFLGVLLMGSLIIIPAAAARNLAINLNSMLMTSALVASVSVILGMLVSELFSYVLGPSIVTVAGILFFISLIFRNK